MGNNAFNSKGTGVAPATGSASIGSAMSNIGANINNNLSTSPPPAAPLPPSAPVASHTFTDTNGNTTRQTYDNSGSTGTNPGLLFSFPGQVAQIGAAGQNAVNTGTTNYNNLNSAAEQGYINAGNTNQIIGQNENAVEHNPNYSLDTGIGRAGQIQQNYGLQGQNALTQAQGLGSLASTALSEQGTGIGALGNAASLNAPGAGVNYYTSPTTGAVTGGGGSAQNAAFQGGQINNAANQGATYNQDETNIQSGENQVAGVNTMISALNLNPAQLNAGNAAIQAIAKQTSGAQYQVLSNYLNGVAASYAPVLGANAPSGQDLINQTANGTSIQTVLSNLDAQAKAVAAGVKAAGSTGTTSDTGTGDSNTNSSSGTGGGWTSLGDK